MGITTNTIECLLAQRQELDFSSTLMLGHQQFFDAQAARYSELAVRYQLPSHQPDEIQFKDGSYADGWFRMLGCKRLDVLDASAYEGATLIHDMNQPLSEDLMAGCAGKMTLVFDGGSLEHIFNVPQALQNIAKFLAIGGHYVGVLPCNNWGGHGFYQFNPELFYRVFEYANGFVETRVWLFNERGQLKSQFWPDPKQVGRRVEFTSQVPMSMLILAKKIEHKQMFEHAFPQQSDYQHQLWQQKR